MQMPFVGYRLTIIELVRQFEATGTKSIHLPAMTHVDRRRDVVRYAGFVLLLCFSVLTVGQSESAITPSIVFTHDETNQIGNVYDMVELDGGAVAVAGYYGVVFFDSNYNVIAKQQLSGALLNVGFVLLPDGLGVAGDAIKTLNDGRKIPHLLVLQPDLNTLDESPLCSSCSVVGAADFDGNGTDSVVVWGDDTITVVDLTDFSEHAISKILFDTKLRNLSRDEVVDLNCDGTEEWLFRTTVEAVLEHQNEWAVYKHFLLYFDEEFKLVEYSSYLEENWYSIRNCSMTQLTKESTAITHYLDGQQVQVSPGNIGFHRTDNPVQNRLHLYNMSGTVKQSWEVRMTGMRRALNFYPIVDNNCLNEIENKDDSSKECSRYVSVYARWGHGCEQFFWEKDDCGSWVLLLEPDGSWQQIATWPNWSFASLLTSDGRLLLHSVGDLLEIKLPTNLVRLDE